MYEFLDTNYLKCSNNFAADCKYSALPLLHQNKVTETLDFFFTCDFSKIENWIDLHVLRFLENKKYVLSS